MFLNRGSNGNSLLLLLCLVLGVWRRSSQAGELQDCASVECEEQRGVREHQLDPSSYEELPEVFRAQTRSDRWQGC